MGRYQKVAFVFPGQGAQYPGMGRDFYESHKVVRETFEEANELLGRDIVSIMLNGPEEALTETHNSQVAIFLMSLALLRVVKEQFAELEPSFVAGHSLGEYSALVASGRLSFEQGLKLVQSRGEYMSAACKQHKGVMAAVIGLDADAVREQLTGIEGAWPANFNSPGQVVISATEAGLEAATRRLKEAGARRVLPLQVHGAFHSPLMQEAEDRLAEEIAETLFESSDIGIVMNVTGKLGAGEEKEILKKQVTSSVQWEQTIATLSDQGVDLFVEIGCGKVLSGLNKRIKVAVPTLNIEKIEDLDLLAKQLEESVV